MLMRSEERGGEERPMIYELTDAEVREAVMNVVLKKHFPTGTYSAMSEVIIDEETGEIAVRIYNVEPVDEE
jgi:hypothetical protein